jgi:hypothetical protein
MQTQVESAKRLANDSPKTTRTPVGAPSTSGFNARGFRGGVQQQADDSNKKVSRVVVVEKDAQTDHALLAQTDVLSAARVIINKGKTK